MAEKDTGVKAPGQSPLDPKSTEELRLELVAHFRNMREPLRRQWVEAMTSKGLTEGQTEQETETESMTIYDTCVDCLDTGGTPAPRSTPARWRSAGCCAG